MSLVELAERRGDGLIITLWHEPEDEVFPLRVHVIDQNEGGGFELVAETGTEGLDKYRHPLAYAPPRLAERVSRTA